jgi:hypothetical protein
MGAFAKGPVALLTFPFSDLSKSKLRPAVLLAHAGRQDWIVLPNHIQPSNRCPFDFFVRCGLLARRFAAKQLRTTRQNLHRT